MTSIPISPPHRFQSSLQQCQNESSYVRGSSLNLLHPPLPHPITTEMDSGTMNEHCGEVNASSGVDLKEMPVSTEMSSTSNASVVDQNEGSEKCVSVNECNSVAVMNGGNSNDAINERKCAVVVNEGNSPIPSNECNSTQTTNECNSTQDTKECISPPPSNDQSTPQSHPSFFSLLKQWFHFFYPVSNKHITHPSQRTLHPLLLTPITSPHHSPLVPSDPSIGHSTATLQCLPRQSGVAPEGSIASPRTPSSSPDSQFSSLHILKIGGSHELPAC